MSREAKKLFKILVIVGLVVGGFLFTMATLYGSTPYGV